MNCPQGFKKQSGLRYRDWINNTRVVLEIIYVMWPYYITAATSCRTRKKFTASHVQLQSTFANGESLHMESNQAVKVGVMKMQMQTTFIVALLTDTVRSSRKGSGKTHSSIDNTLGSMYSYILQGGGRGPPYGDGDIAESEPFSKTKIASSNPISSGSHSSLNSADSEQAVVLPRSSGPH